ncbi:DOMON domain-containing protein FRRS1L-like [Paramacrobiotus metropolitanus]|uniref:DOMON domain-containing protein FRRS1L-like n=1 Tax=Paramacrobiotus metropolitanus TaxID=2943436 RepID=UPI0024461577|nr:DOMON domain-containing protein FRRS1L-like [Paramacrobiotus metropolitanus]
MQSYILPPVLLILTANVAAAQNTGCGSSLSSVSQTCQNSGSVCHSLQAQCWQAASCEFLASIATANDAVTVDLLAAANGNQLQLNLTGNRWIGVGFSMSGGMANSAVVHCFHDANDTVQAKLTYNIPNAHFNIGWQNVDQAPLNVQSASYVNNELHCVVKLQKKFTIQSQAFDLNQPVTLIAATGPLRNNTIAMHDRDPAISKQKASF